jgi:hypothetical protein
VRPYEIGFLNLAVAGSLVFHGSEAGCGGNARQAVHPDIGELGALRLLARVLGRDLELARTRSEF